MRGERREVRAALDLGKQVFRLLLHRRVVFAFGLEQDVARAHLLGRRVLLLVVLVVALDVLRAHAGPLPDRLQVDERVLDLALLGDAVVVLVRLEMRCDLGIA